MLRTKRDYGHTAHSWLCRQGIMRNILQHKRMMVTMGTESKLIMQGLAHIVILQHARKNPVQLKFILQLASYRRLGTMQLGRRHHLHGRSHLQRVLHGSNPGLYFFQRSHITTFQQQLRPLPFLLSRKSQGQHGPPKAEPAHHPYGKPSSC